jgi:glycerophosphoryl diester phosphodiesterase
MNTKNPLLFAHRGASLLAPENTRPAFERAFENGASWIECDVQISSDEKLVIIHDDTVDRTTDGQGLVYQTSAFKLSQLDAGSWFDKAYAHASIPRLDTLFALLSGYQTHANLELKATDNPLINQRTAELLAAALPALRKKAPTSEIIISSFDPQALITFAKLSPRTPLALLLDVTTFPSFEKETRNIQALLKQLPQIVSLNVNDVHLDDHTRHLCEKCVARWMTLHPSICVYTINDEGRARWLIREGISGIFTDDVGLIQKLQPPR